MNILIVYFYNEYPLRRSASDLLWCFKRHAPHHVYYLNTAVSAFSAYLKKIKFDLIVFHDMFISRCWRPDQFERIQEKVAALKNYPAPKIALPQDEYIYTNHIVEFINRFNINCVFTLASVDEAKKIYAGVDCNKVKFFRVLTGYLEDSLLKKIKKWERKTQHKDIDIGYRAFKALPNLGRRGLMKTEIGKFIEDKAPAQGFKCDISNDPCDTIFGDEWYKFLLRCKFTIGVEGGASLMDRDGELFAGCKKYVEQNPNASFDEVERELFPGRDGEINYFALSPRHLEACATRTCQVLVEGDYNGILKPAVHYLELKKDFSNSDTVLNQMKDEKTRKAIINRVYADIVESQKYSFKNFVSFVLDQSLPQKKSTQTKKHPLRLFLNRLHDTLSWGWVILNWKVFNRKVF